MPDFSSQTMLIQQVAGTPEWTWIWLGVLGAAFLIALIAFGLVLVSRRGSAFTSIADSRIMRRSAAFLKYRTPRLHSLLHRFVHPRLSTSRWSGLALTTSAVVIFAAVYAFILIAEGWTDEEALLTLDRYVYDWLVQAGGSDTVDFMRFMTRLGDGLVVTGIAVLVSGILLVRSQYERVAALVLASGVGSLVVLGLKELFNRARPDVQVYEMTGHSFPSGHSFNAMVLFGFIIYLVFMEVRNELVRIALAACLGVLILLVGLSRIILRVHWVSDVAGGFTIGLAWLVLSLVIVRAVSDRTGIRGNS